MNNIYKDKANKLARHAHAYYCQRMPNYKAEDFNANLARAIYDVLVDAVGGILTQQKVPETDSQVEQRINELYTDGSGPVMLSMYGLKRKQGASVLRAWGEVLHERVGIPVSDHIKEL